MKFLTDLHIHTVSSGHAYSTIDEIAREASRVGLEVIGITDHTHGLPGGAHDFHFHNLSVVPRDLYGVKVLRGAEANIIDFKGTIDAGADITERLDYVIASYHPPCIRFGEVEECTNGFIGAMENPIVKIIGHPGDNRYPFNHMEIAKAAQKTRTLLEVNNASLKPNSYRPGTRDNLVELLSICNKLDLPILANTDSHIAYQVGEFTDTIAFLKSIQFPEELILNLHPEKMLEYISYTD